jgi:hypothetical protein
MRGSITKRIFNIELGSGTFIVNMSFLEKNLKKKKKTLIVSFFLNCILAIFRV